MLFRKEAVSHQSERLTGDISLAQPLSLRLTVCSGTGAPSEIVQELLFDNDVIVLKAALSMAIFKNNIGVLSLLVAYSSDIKAYSVDDFFTEDTFPQQVSDDVLRILNDRKLSIGVE